MPPAVRHWRSWLPAWPEESSGDIPGVSDIPEKEVHERDRGGGFRGIRRYFLVVDDWSARSDTLRQRVRARDYRHVNAGDTVEFVVRSGMLGARYIEEVRRVE